jgi:hypothetical protein
MEFLSTIAGFFVPRFVTDWVVLYENENGDLYTAMTMEVWDEELDPAPDAVMKVKALSWLGIGWKGKADGEPMPFDEWKASYY